MAPRLPRGGKSAPKGSPNAPPAKGSVPGDNRSAVERAEQAQLLSIVSRLRAHAPKIEAAKKALDDEKAIEKEIYRVATAAGFQKAEIKEYLEDLKPGQGRAVDAREVARVRRRRWLGLSVGEQQPDLEERMPEEARDEQYWAQQGFAWGLTGGSTAVFPEGIPSRMDQIWARAVEAGNLEGQKIIADVAPKLTGGAAAVGAKAAEDFAADNPEIDVEAAARKLKNDPKFMDRGPGEEEPGPEGAEALGPKDGGEGPQPIGAAEEPFEASAEELEAQKPRQAIVDAHEGATSGGEVV